MLNFLLSFLCLDSLHSHPIPYNIVHSLHIMNYVWHIANHSSYITCPTIHIENPAYRQNLALTYVCDTGEPILNHEFKPIPLVLSIPWVHVYTMIRYLYHESISIPWFRSNNKSHCPYHESKNLYYGITEIPVKQKFPKKYSPLPKLTSSSCEGLQPKFFF